MPGILPMKVIKVGTSSQSRIAQACDRCRSKKIRCDGRSCCSQCALVGFECRTSDKLSRRAFPRGYTESLEERVRVLEGEVRDLKDLLDEKDEKIDMLSKMHGNRGSSFGNHSSPGSSPSTLHSDRSRKDSSSATPPPKEDTFRVHASPLLLGVENSDSYFMGASSGRAFIETLKRRMQESGKSCSDFNPEAFLHIQGCYPLTSEPPSSSKRIPPRLFSDRCVNAYFQEWAPLFPVVHKPSFLRLYEDFVGEPEKVKNNHRLAQLNLVFCISALSNDQPELEQIAACEKQWQRALDAVLMDNTIVTLQCLVLAMMYCMLRADYKRLQHYKGVAVGLSHRLGLHQSQKRFSFGALTIETRKKVFWTLYTLDCFSAAILGLPKLLKEDDIHAEYPSDTDDEYVTEKGFQPTLPGEYTRLSSALALFRGARILAKVLERNYPAATSHELSLQSMSSMEAELDAWNDALPNHLKLTFKQDKPSTDITGSRSPLLALAYYYTKILIFRPAIGSSLGSKAAPAVFAVGESSKHLIQIVQLLEERNMAFAFCLNRSDLLINCGMSLLFQGLDLGPDSMVAKDGARLINAVVKICDQVKAPGRADFRRIAATVISVDDSISSIPSAPVTVPARRRGSSGSNGNMAAPPARASPPTASAPLQRTVGQIKDHRQQPQPHPLGRHYSKVASASETDLLLQQEQLRRMTIPNVTTNTTHNNNKRSTAHRSQSRASFDGAARPNHDILSNGSATSARQREHRLSMSAAQMLARVAPPPQQRTPSQAQAQSQSLDYLSLDSTSPTSQQPSSPVQVRAPSQHLQQRQQQMAQQQRRQHEQQQQLLTPAQLAQKLSAGGTSAGVSTAEWEALLGSMEGGSLNVYDSIYGGPGLAALGGAGSSAETLTPTSTTTPPVSALSASSGRGAWSPDPWDLSGFPMGGGGAGAVDCLASGAALSVLSLSDESLSCSSGGGEELGSVQLSADGLELDLGLELDMDYRNALASAAGPGAEAYLLDGLEGTFGI